MQYFSEMPLTISNAFYQKASECKKGSINPCKIDL